VAAEYDRAAKGTEEPAPRESLTWISDHELYHTDIFNDLLKREKGRGRIG